MKRVTSQPSFRFLETILPANHSEVFVADRYATLASEVQGECRVLDLGCGPGNTIDLFKEVAPKAQWHGVDIEDSPEVRTRLRNDGIFATFDGKSLPYDDAYFDLIFCRQVLEHVRHPDLLVPEVFRVLKQGGLFAGSVSYLEPYHSFSIFNFTPYGISQVFGSAGLELRELRPGTDAFTMILRQILGKPKWFRIVERASPMHALIEGTSRLFRLKPQQRNFVKIQFSGHVCFLAQRPPNVESVQSRECLT